MQTLLYDYQDRFDGLGKLKDIELRIHTDPAILPTVQKPRRLPILMQKQVDTEIDKLLDLGVIEPVTKPPTWVNPLVVVPKRDSSNVRICVDMRAANVAIIREPYQISTLDDMLYTFNGCTKFTKLDLNKGYHQISLAPESRDLTTFASHRGIFRYTRLIFGMSAAAELYQKEIEIALTGLPGVKNISDDIIIGGKDENELLQRMEQTFSRLREKQLTINRKKCEFLKDEITYMGHKLSANGISPDKTKINTITALNAPQNVKELRSFLGMITYCAKFIPNFATITEPLRQLLKKGIPWTWDISHQSAFDTLKRLLLSTTTLAYFNPDAYTEVVADASPVGLGAVIFQQQSDGTLRPISYASRALTSVERRYSQIERESLAILFAIQRFRNYLYGIKFDVITDHKPLVTMFSVFNKQLPPRIERWVMRLMPYNFTVKYRAGSQNSADYLSRSNPLVTSKSSHVMAEEYITYISQNSLPLAVSSQTIEEEQRKDTKLSMVRTNNLSNNFPKHPTTKEFYPIRHLISIANNILLFKNKIIIPSSLQETMLALAHEGHQGIVHTKQRLRSKVWWPGMNQDIYDYISKCHSCQVVTPVKKKPPLQMTPIPNDAWLMLGCDLCGPFPSGESLLVCIDYYSRYPDVEILHKTTTSSITNKLRKSFCRYGAPETLVTDNEPQFANNKIFDALMKEFGVNHRKVTPYHPEANGEVERFNQNLKKCIQAAITAGQNWRIALQNYLLSYRTTPHATTGVAPANLLFG